MKFNIEKASLDNKEEWLEYINSKDETTFVDLWQWRELLEKVYNLSHFWYIARNGNKIEGILALSMTIHPIFGKYLVTAPFANQGGFYADSERAFKGLLNKAIELRNGLKVRYINIRHLNGENDAPDGWRQGPLYATYHLPLNQDPDVFFHKHLRAKTRNKISKSIKNNFIVEFGHLELLDDFWYVISHSMKELGSPYHSKFYLETLLKTLGSKAEFVILYGKDKQPVGASLLIHHHQKVVLLHANFLRKYRPLRAGEFLYWSIISECCRRGKKLLDLGRSLKGSGNEHFKMKLRPIRHTLAYWFYLPANKNTPELNQSNPRFQLAMKTWQRMPLWFVRLIGPRLISGIL